MTDNFNFNNAPEGYTDVDLIDTYALVWTAQGNASHSWAANELDDIVREQPERGWTIILSLIERTLSDELLAIIAAGPLEALLCEHGTDFIERVEDQARRDPHFRHALAGVWGWSSMLPDIYRRMRLVVGNETL